MLGTTDLDKEILHMQSPYNRYLWRQDRMLFRKDLAKRSTEVSTSGSWSQEKWVCRQRENLPDASMWGTSINKEGVKLQRFQEEAKGRDARGTVDRAPCVPPERANAWCLSKEPASTAANGKSGSEETFRGIRGEKVFDS